MSNNKNSDFEDEEQSIEDIISEFSSKNNTVSDTDYNNSNTENSGTNISSSASSPKQEKNPKQSNHKKSRLFLKISLCLLAIAIIASISFFGWLIYGYTGIYPGITVLGIESGFLSEAELTERLSEVSISIYSGKLMPVVVNNTRYTISSDDAEVRINVPDTVSAALSYGRTGNAAQKFKDIFVSLIAGKDIPAKISVNTDILKRKSEEICSLANSEVSQPSYEIKDSTLYLNVSAIGSESNADELYKLVYEHLSTADFSTVAYNSTDPKKNMENLKLVLSKIARQSKNAYLDLENDPKGNTIIPHEDGIEFDLKEATKALENCKGSYVEIPVEIYPPEITTDELKNTVFADVLSEVTTIFNQNLTGRTTNIKIAAGFIDGTVLTPGGEFSFNDIVGPRTKARGFKDAKVFQSGEIVDGIGGGICQVSTTIYMAAIYSNFEILERRNHMYAVSYAPLGQDATVVYGSTDFRFKNSSEYPVRIRAQVAGNKLTVTVYGTKTNNNTVEISTVVNQKNAYKTLTVEDSTLEAGKSKTVQDGYTGYKTTTYRIIYDENGNEISKVLENTSKYSKLDKIVNVGVKGEDAQAGLSSIATSSESTGTKPEGQSTLPDEDSGSHTQTSETVSQTPQIQASDEPVKETEANVSPVVQITQPSTPASTVSNSSVPAHTSSQSNASGTDTSPQTTSPAESTHSSVSLPETSLQPDSER